MYIRLSSVSILLLSCALNAGAGEPAVDPLNPPPPPAVPAPTDSPFTKLFEGLQSPDAAVRELSAKALMKEIAPQIEASDKIYLKKIAAGIASEKAEERTAALAEWKSAFENTVQYNKEAMAALIKQLESTDANVRALAQISFVAVVNLVIENKIIEKLVEDLASTDAAVSTQAVEKLKAMGEDAAFNLVHALEDERMQVRRLSLEVLKAIGPKAKSVSTDLAFLLDNDDKNVRRSAAAVLESLGPAAAEATGDLVNYLSSDEKAVRRLAVNILKKIGPAAAEGSGDLIDLLSDDDKNIRAVATEALVAIGTAARECVENLIGILKDEEADEDSKERAIKVLAVVGGASKPALPELKRLANEGKTEALKTSAAEAAAKIEAAPEPPVEPKEPAKIEAPKAEAQK